MEIKLLNTEKCTKINGAKEKKNKIDIIKEHTADN